MRERLLLIGLLILPFLITVEAQTTPFQDCQIAPSGSNPDPANLTAVKNVSTVGHYDGGPYTLYCGDTWYRELGEDLAFSYITGGHVRSPDATPAFIEEQSLGTNVECRVSNTGSCDSSEVCVFKMNNENDAHVADCADPTVPQPNAYPYQLCCQIQEACNDGIDNDEDGLVDCVDPDCNEKDGITTPGYPNADMNPGAFFQPAGVCDYFDSSESPPDSPYDANMQNTTECVNNPSNCTDPDGDIFYCAYGDYDNPDIEPRGVCCPPDTIPEKIGDSWRCTSTDECGIGSGRPCKYNITSNESAFFNSTYSGNETDYCVSQVPRLFTNSDQPTPPNRSQACCRVPKYGRQAYWFKDGNVKIYG